MNFGPDDQLNRLVERIQLGDPEATDQLLEQSYEGFQALAQNIAGARSDAVVQTALLSLNRALADTEVRSVQHYWSLAAIHIRRERLDLNRQQSIR